MKSERFITPRQAARLADCETTYIHDRARRRSFDSERIAGRVLVDRESFLKWLKDYQIRRRYQPERKSDAGVFA